MTFYRQHIRYFMFVAFASLLLMQQATVGHEHHSVTEGCVVCKVLENHTELAVDIELFSQAIIAVRLVSLVFSYVDFINKISWMQPFLRAPPFSLYL